MYVYYIWSLYWYVYIIYMIAFTSVQFSRSVVSNSLWPCRLQHTRPHCCCCCCRFSRVRLCATAHQAPPSLGFSRQEHWSGLPFPSPMHEMKSESEVTQLGPTLRDPMDRSLPGSSIHGIFQARVLEWGAIAFSMKQNYLPKIKCSL